MPRDKQYKENIFLERLWVIEANFASAILQSGFHISIAQHIKYVKTLGRTE